MIVYEPGDVVLVPYPFGERAGGRKRPGLVISPAEFHETTTEIVIAQITSRLSGDHGPLPPRYPPNHPGPAASGKPI